MNECASPSMLWMYITLVSSGQEDQLKTGCDVVPPSSCEEKDISFHYTFKNMKWLKQEQAELWVLAQPT